MIYEYKCGVCQQKYGLVTDMDDDYSRKTYVGMQCDRACPGRLARVFSISVAKSMEEHWNPTVGKPISNMGQMRSELSRKSDEMAERLRMPVNYQPVDLREKDALGVTDEGIHVYDRSYARGSREESVESHPSNPAASEVIWLPPLPPPT